MYKFNYGKGFFLKLTTAEEAFHFMMLERDSAWKDLAVQDNGDVVVMYGFRQARDADYAALRHVMKR